jgi:division protein CdvB (Snf7/Vps24/ESCRT-III family)
MQHREMGSISDKWNDFGRSDNLSQRILDKVKPDVPLKNRIDVAQKNLQLQIVKLDSIAVKIKQKHDYIFNKIVAAQKSNNNLHAKAYATELLEIRKMHNMVNGAKLALEQIQLRLNTVSELGDIVVTLSPCMSVIKGLGASLSGIMPEATNSMQNLSQILGDVLTGSSMNSTDTMTSYSPSADTLAILEEAQSIIEGQTRANIPEPPTSTPSAVTERKGTLI